MKRTALLLALVAPWLMATTIVLPDPTKLADNAAAVAEVTVERVDVGAERTVTKLRVDKAYKGVGAGKVIELDELGGSRFVIGGVARYRAEEKALVFLDKDAATGKLTTAMLLLGHVPLGTGGDKMVVAPSEARDDPVMRLQAALRAQLGGGTTYSAGGLEGTRAAVTTYRMLQPPSRWREAWPVRVWAPDVPDAKIGEPSLRVIGDAVAAWSMAPGTEFRGAVVGSQPGTGMACNAGKLSISLNDPKNQIAQPQGCGGVLAFGGFCSDGSPKPDGFQTIVSGAVTVADGWGDCWLWTAGNLAEVLTHEIGHALGFGHSVEQGQSGSTVLNDATMSYIAHFDGRKAGLREYDLGVVQYAYPGAGATPTPVPGTKTPVPTAPPGAGAAASRGEVTWRLSKATQRTRTTVELVVNRVLDLSLGQVSFEVTGTEGTQFVLTSPASADPKRLVHKAGGHTLGGLVRGSVTSLNLILNNLPAGDLKLAVGNASASVTVDDTQFTLPLTCAQAYESASLLVVKCR